jgi:hypothetical protein
MTFRGFLWPARVLLALLIAVAVIILITVSNSVGAVMMLAILGGLVVWILYRPGAVLTDDHFIYRPFFWRRRRIGWDHVRGFSVANRPGRAGSTIKVVAANTSDKPVMMWALTFHSAAWTDQLCDTLNREGSKRRQHRTTK